MRGSGLRKGKGDQFRVLASSWFRIEVLAEPILDKSNEIYRRGA